MLGKVLLTALIILVIYYYFQWLKRSPNAPSRQTMVRYGLGAAVVVLVLLAATGRLHWLFAVIGSLLVAAQRLLPLMRFAPLVHRLYGQYNAARSPSGSPGGQSRVRTTFLLMTLDHETGNLDGEVLAGRFKGHRLKQLSLNQVLELRSECAGADRESLDLLDAYLDREFGDGWRERAGAAPGDGASGSAPNPQSGMTSAEAYEILGLEPGAERAQIIDAHRRLIQRLHPDRGGSAYLASAINRAKDLLLANSA